MAKHETSNETFVNPYHFIPLEEECKKDPDYLKHREENDSNSKTGWVECEIETKTPIFIPNTTNPDFFQERQNGVTIQSYDFFSYNDLKDDKSKGFHLPVIPGSSLRGTIRSAFETLTNSCLSTTDHKHYLYKRFAMQYSNAGRIIKNENDQYLLQPCTFEKFRNQNIDNVTTFCFQGEIGIKKDQRSKKIFTIDKSKKPTLLSKDDILIFKKILELYRDNRINKKLGSGNNDHYGYKHIKHIDGALVFYENKNNKLYISPAQIGKEVFHNKLTNLINTYEPCDSKKNLCPACSLYGIAGENDAVASRVRFTDANIKQTPDDLKSLFMSHGILPELASPKESATEFYLNKKSDSHDIWNYDYAGYWEGNKYSKKFIYDKNYNATIQGRKMYWHQKDVSPFINENVASKRNVMIRPLIEGVKFTFKVHFNQITEKELKQLLWVLSIGGKDGMAHKIGMGKPVGLGSIHVKIKEVKERKVNIENGEFQYALKTQSIDFSNSDLGFPENTIKAFLKMADFDDNLGNIHYPENVGSNGKHYEWFSANKTDHFSPTIIQSFEPLVSSNPDLRKFKLASKNQHHQKTKSNKFPHTSTVPSKSIQTGNIKYFDESRGFGFIDNGNTFFHISIYKKTFGDKTPQNGDKVRYIQGKGKKGIEVKEFIV